MEDDKGKISIYGASEHNLKHIDVELPRNSLCVITGLSGSGKSSLAFDTIYAEGQRRYMETFSAYARTFIGDMHRPTVEQIVGLSPVVSIEQKTTIRNPRSTVGTITDIYGYLRLLYARASTAYSYKTGEKMVRMSDKHIIETIINDFDNKAVYILAPLVDGRKGNYKDLFESMLRHGFINARVDGKLTDVKYDMRLDRYKTHFIELVVDKLIVRNSDMRRLSKSVDFAMQYGKGVIMLWLPDDNDTIRYFSRYLMCPTTGISYKDPAPYTFAFNTPQGACPKCNGLGYITSFDMEKIVPNNQLSINEGGILPIGKRRNSLLFWTLEALADKLQFSLDSPICELPEEVIDALMNGFPERLQIQKSPLGEMANYSTLYEGVAALLQAQYDDDDSHLSKKVRERFGKETVCPQCHGSRLRTESLHFKIDGKNIAELCEMDIPTLYKFINRLPARLPERERLIAAEILKEIKTRLTFLLDVGLDYLSLNRSANSLSGGESQRIRLATQIGSQLVNVLYILDEPSIGLHQRDNNRLINSLQSLRDRGNSVIVVEHDREIIERADYVVDMGPGAGRKGGEVLFSGSPAKLHESNSLTAQYIDGRLAIPVPQRRRKGNGTNITIHGATGNNLRNITVDIPLGLFVCITGVSGSGKSSLLNKTLAPILGRHFYNAMAFPLPCTGVTGLENINKYIEINQAAIGRTPRSNPATFTGIFADIRELFASLPEAKIRGYKAGRFSFNISGGRCETCKGAGVKTIEMNFLPDVYVTCEACGGKRYNRETLEVKFKGKSIVDVLNMTINAAVELFENIPYLHSKLSVLQQVGLGYVKLGQSSTTLSGGEAQRVKLAAELMRKDTGQTLYILDEPTTGLHFADIQMLLDVLNNLVDRGNSIIIIEHNMDVIKSADWVIDMGPEGGKNGGSIVDCGSPEDIAQRQKGYTGKYLATELNR